MPRKTWIDKANATTYTIVHRPQDDPRIHDEASTSLLFHEVDPPNSRKIKNRADLESDLFRNTDGTDVRENEGEAAEYGVYYDDTQYDYMQHLKDLNSGGGESYFVEAPSKPQKGKATLKLEDALREASLDDRVPSYQDQQDVPDELLGFQPDMDPALREVLEALEDEAYVDHEEDIFQELTSDVKGDAVEGGGCNTLDELDDGWETDETTKPSKESEGSNDKSPNSPVEDIEMRDEPPLAYDDGAFMQSFTTQVKPLTNLTPNTVSSASAPPRVPSSVTTSSSLINGGKRKKRKGAMTSRSSNLSMTSGSLARTEGQSILDARFEKVLEDYAEEVGDEAHDDGDVSMLSGNTGVSMLSKASSRISGISRLSNASRASNVSKGSAAPSLAMRSDFNDIMDDFLENYSMAGRKRVKKGGYQTGMEQLDEIRKGLGPAKVK